MREFSLQPLWSSLHSNLHTRSPSSFEEQAAPQIMRRQIPVKCSASLAATSAYLISPANCCSGYRRGLSNRPGLELSC